MRGARRRGDRARGDGGRTRAAIAGGARVSGDPREAEWAAIEARILDALDRAASAEAATLALRAYGPGILAYLIVVLRDRQMAEDTFADFGEQLWKGIGGFRRECSFRAWAYRVAWCCAVHTLRDPYRRRGRRLETREVSEILAPMRTQTARWLETESKSQLEELRASLEPGERALLVLRLDRRLSWTEVARALQDDGEAPATEAALRKRFERIKERLRALAEERGLLEPR
ncbi:MAG: sigma-70 family RNA polymerase sigma factor [Deltaproteobacteria bacterium]|nr:sigma-70 family RNA polymerase sigma factor [Deltaproteobacteria bacterium]